MKIVQFNTLYPPTTVGGAERSVASLARGLVESGHDVVVASIAPHGAPVTESVDGVTVHRLPLDNVYWPFDADRPRALSAIWHALDVYNPWMAKRVRELLVRLEPDVVHTNNLMGFSTAVWSIANDLKLPVVHTLRDYSLLCPRTTMFRQGRDCIRQCLPCTIYSFPKQAAERHVDAVVGISEFILERHVRHGRFLEVERREIIRNPYRPPSTPPPPRADHGPLRLGFLGRLERTKGVDLALALQQHLSPFGTTLLVGGIGNDAYVDSLVDRHGGQGVTLLGFVQPEHVLNTIDLLLVPSRWNEPMGRVVAEAYTLGVPVLASRRGGLPELVDEGKTGFLLDPDDPSAWFTLGEDLARDPSRVRAMRPACIERSREFQPTAVTDRYASLFDAIVDDARKARA